MNIRVATESAEEREGRLQLLYDAGIMCYLRMRQDNALLHGARMARARSRSPKMPCIRLLAKLFALMDVSVATML